MKIAYVADIRLPTEKAHGYQVMQMCAAFASLGHEVRLYVPKRKNPIDASPWEYYGMEETFEIMRVPSSDFVRRRWLGRFGQLLTNLSFALSGKRRLRAWKPDIVYARDRFSALWAPEESLHVTELHTLPSSGRWVFRRIWNKSDRIVAVTGGLKEDLIAMGLPGGKIMVAHDAADPHRFRLAESKEESREALGLPQNIPLAVYVGRFYKEQGVGTLMKAAETLHRAKVVFVGGEGECRNGIFAGRIPPADIPRWLNACDIAVMPYAGGSRHVSRYASPMKLFEYLAAGKPIVSSDLPSVREVLTEDAAVFVPSDDHGALADAIDALAGDPGRLREMGDASDRLGRRHGWSARATAVLAGLPRSPGERFKTWLGRYRAEIAVLVLALTARLAHVLFSPMPPLEGSDAPIYLALADAIRGTRGFAGLPEFWQPGYPYLLAGIRSVFGEALIWPRLMNVLLSAGTVALVMCMGRRWLGRSGAVIAGLLAALHVPAILDTGMLLTETTFTFFLTLGVFLFLAALENGGWKRSLAAGLVLTAAGFVREIGLYFSLILAGMAVFMRGRRRLAIAVLAFIFAGAGLTSLVHSDPVDTGTDRILSKGYEQTVLNDRVFKENAYDPGRLLMYPEGLVRFFIFPHHLAAISGRVAVKPLFLEGDVAGLADMWQEVAAKLSMTVYHWLLLLLAVYGLARGGLPGKVRIVFILLIAAAAGSIVFASVGRPDGFAVYEPLARYRFPVMPLIILLAASGLARWTERSVGLRLMRMFASRQYALFLVIGGATVVMNLVLTWTLTEIFGLFYFLSYVLSTLVAWTIMFVLHSRLTFRGHGEHERKAYTRFIVMYVGLTLMNWLFVYLLTSAAGLHYLLSIVLVTGAISVISFLGNRLLVFNGDRYGT